MRVCWKKMRELCYIAAVGLLLGMAFPAAADEGYDPMLFSSEEEANNNLFSIMPPTPPKINPVKTAPQNSLRFLPKVPPGRRSRPRLPRLSIRCRK